MLHIVLSLFLVLVVQSWLGGALRPRLALLGAGTLGRRHAGHHHRGPVIVGQLLLTASDDASSVVNSSTAGLPQPQPQPLPDPDEAAKVANLPRSYVVLAILLLTFASNQWARQALYYLCDFSASGNPVEHINVALGFDKEMYAALASFGFTIVFALVSLFAGGVSDSTDRSRLAGLSCLVWSGATALQSQARGFADLVPLRAVIGASQAFYNPAAYTLLADIFPKNMVGTVNGIFSSGVYLGGALASLSILLDRAVGWRATLQCVGAVGVIAAALVLVLVPEPRAANLQPASPAIRVDGAAPEERLAVAAKAGLDVPAALASAATAVAAVLQSYEARLLFSAATLRFCAGFSIGIWKAPFVFAKFAGNEAAFAGSNAFIVAVGGLLSSLLGGYLSDRLANPNQDSASGLRARPRARAWVPAIGSLLAAPLWAAFCLTDSSAVAAGVLFLEYLVAECWFGPTLAALFNAVPSSSRGTAQGLFSVLAALGNLAPVVVGAFAGGALGSYQLGDVLLVSVCGCYVACSALFVLAALEDDRKIAQREGEREGGSEGNVVKGL